MRSNVLERKRKKKLTNRRPFVNDRRSKKRRMQQTCGVFKRDLLPSLKPEKPIQKSYQSLSVRIPDRVTLTGIANGQ